MDILSVKNLSISFSDKKIVDNLSFNLKEKSITAIVGQSGSGKSVTILSFLKLLHQSFNVSGKVDFISKDLLKLTEKQLCKIRGNQISMIFQDPMTSLNPLHDIRRQISESIKIHNQNYSKAKLNDKVSQLLDMVGLSELKERIDLYPHQLSGGQRQRVMIAMAIANDVKILIADEPTTALDIENQDAILDLLLDLREKLNLTILFITHNLRVVEKLADNVLVMKNGKIVEEGKTKAIFKSPKSDYTKLLISSVPSDLKNSLDSKNNIIEVSNLNVKYLLKKNFFGINNKDFYANKNISFSLKVGNSLGIIGGSGSGKSTLAQAISGLIKSEGKILFENNDISKFSVKQKNSLKKDIQIIFQDPYSSLNPRMKIKDIIAEGLKIHNIDLNIDEEVNKILKEVEIELSAKDKYPHQFSGGQRQRIAIARSLILKPKLLILDEPTSALDLLIQNEILQLLQKLQKKHKISYILISHDLDVINAMCDKVRYIKGGLLSDVR